MILKQKFIYVFYLRQKNESFAEKVETFIKPFPQSLKHFQPIQVEKGKGSVRRVLQEVDHAQVIILLISAQLNAWSGFQEMMETLIERARNQEARVIPILVKSCLYDERLVDLKPLPSDNSFLNKHPEADWPTIFTEIAKKVRDAITEVREDLYHRVTDLYNQALKWEENGNREFQIDVLKRALKLIPKHPSLLESLGTAYFELKRYLLANDILAELLSIDPHHEEALKMSAIAYFQREEYSLAIEVFEKYLAIDTSSEDLDTLNEYKNCLIASGNEHKLYLPYFWMAKTYHKNENEHDQAAKYYKLALDVNPKHYELNAHFAIFAYECGLMEYYERHAEIARTQAPTKRKLIIEEILSMKRGNFIHWEDMPKSGKTRKEFLPRMNYLKERTQEAHLQLKGKNINEALQIWKTVLRYHWNNYFAQMGLIRTYNEKKRFHHIAALYGQYAYDKIRKRNQLCINMLKALRLSTCEKAMAIINQLLAFNPNNKSYQNLKKWTEEKCKK